MTDPEPDLRSIPTVDDFTSATIEDRYDDMISPFGLTNHWATVQVDHDVLAVRSLNVPPVSQGDSVSGRLYLAGRLAQASGQPVRHTWRPDRVLRETVIDDWHVETVTVVPWGEPGVLVRIRVTNTAATRRALRLGVWVHSLVTQADHPWLAAEPPQQDNSLHRQGSWRWGSPQPGRDGEGVRCRRDLSPAGRQVADVPSGPPAHSLQVLLDSAGEPVEDRSPTPRLIEIDTDLDAGRSWEGSYLHLIGADEEALRAAADRIRGDAAGAVEAAESAWNAELEAIFTPGNDLYGGSLPRLETSNAALRALYWWGALGTIWFRRDNPASVLGRTYDTLMPRYWQTTTFIWDYSLSSHVHAQLDPNVLRRQLAHWVGLDINRHFGTEWLTGGPVGYWYSVNQYAMVRLVSDYLRFTGDLAFLAEEIVGPDGNRRSVGDHLRDWAVSWMDKRGSSPLADYGDIDNLLECVSSYVHEVASLQAANVWSMRTAAAVSDLEGRTEDAARLRDAATDLVPEVLALYRPGDGFFNARQPDGTLQPTRHCYDFATVGTTIAADLDDSCRAEMVDFFDRELRTPAWLRALSAADADAGFSVRPDHQWNGAYPAWPADAARSAIALGGAEIVADWVQGLSRTVRQGPPGQAHFVEDAVPPIDGGARKAPGQYPYLIDWSCSSAGAWCELVIGSIFGLEVGLDGAVTASGCLDSFDPRARLVDLVVRGERYQVDQSGVSRSTE
ncbi:hypothetical protein B0O41_2523 [Propionibacteriaceae bacterium ES.041]|nr:hypothetical protein B0O41_2523 [Propionibacteriaceae bacterium ES.041]